ncbi:MAG: FIST C-terminal domain-containing protein, partial [Candidatus Binatia bacterium]
SKFNKTYVYFDGEFRSGVSTIALVRTIHPFKIFSTDHFVPSNVKMVITEADPANRIVTEINAEPAGLEYARLLGLDLDALTPMVFATHPVVVKVGGRYYTRSIRNVNEDGSLTFFCAVDKGIVLTISKCTDILKNLEENFKKIKADIGSPQLVIGCDCVLRGLELEQKQLKIKASRIMIDNNVIGFSTYGEEFQSMHLNQTFTGAAIGVRQGRS